mgnify:CR=1 FL=1
MAINFAKAYKKCLHVFLSKKIKQALFSYKTATIVTWFNCQCCLISFDAHIHIVRYTHSHRSIWTCASNDVRWLKWRFRITSAIILCFLCVFLTIKVNHPHAPTNASRLSMSCGFRGAGPISWNPLQAPKERSCGYNMIPHPYRSPKGDWHINYDVEDDSRSRFAEPRESEVMPIPQLRSFGACSGFLMDTCPLGTRRWLMTCYGRLRGYGETP